MTADFEVIVIGARIAGSIVSTLLGQRGYRVLLLDRARFPSDTISTHFFRFPSFHAFDQLGVFDTVDALAPRMVNNFNNLDGRVFTEPVAGPGGPSHHLCVRRFNLDRILVDRAKREQAVSLREGAHVEELLVGQGRITGVRWIESGTRHTASARVVVGADGLHSVVAKQVHPDTERYEPVRRAMYYAYYAGMQYQPGPAAEFHYRGNRLVYVFPADSGLALIAASVPIEDFPEFRKDPESRLERELEEINELRDRLHSAERVGPVRGAGNIPGYQRRPFGPGWALVGDSGQIMDPWSGQGIDQAATHALFLAECLDKWLSGGVSWDNAMAEFNRKRHEFSDKTFDRTCTYARDFRPMTDAALKKRGIPPRLGPPARM